MFASFGSSENESFLLSFAGEELKERVACIKK